MLLIINVKTGQKENTKTVFEIYSELNDNELIIKIIFKICILIKYIFNKNSQLSKRVTKLDLNICNDTLMNNEIRKCSNYTIESLLEDLCISCQEHFYPFYSDIPYSNPFLKCYNNPEGYYLDLDDKSYRMLFKLQNM